MTEERPFDPGRDRKKHLRVAVHGTVLVEREGGPEELPCRELSVGGAVLATSVPPAVGARLELSMLRLGEETYELGVLAEVVGAVEEGVEIEFVEMDPVTKSNVQAAFTAAVAPMLAERKASYMAMRFQWAFRDIYQLVDVCRTLLTSVELIDAWTPEGPSGVAAEALVGNGTNLTPSQQAMLRVVAGLWSGSLDVSLDAAGLPEASRASLDALEKALTRGPSGVDEWLTVERRGAQT